MKIVITIFLLLVSAFSYSQKVFSVNYTNQADVKVFVVAYENEADLKVFKVKYPNEAGKNDGELVFYRIQRSSSKKYLFCKL